MPFLTTEDCKRLKKAQTPTKNNNNEKNLWLLKPAFAFLEVEDALDYCCFFRPFSIFLGQFVCGVGMCG